MLCVFSGNLMLIKARNVKIAKFLPQSEYCSSSGVGQVVLQVAASVTCKECYGIEKADTPAEFSIAMEKEFIRWMAWFGKTYSPFKVSI